MSVHIVHVNRFGIWMVMLAEYAILKVQGGASMECMVAVNAATGVSGKWFARTGRILGNQSLDGGG